MHILFTLNNIFQSNQLSSSTLITFDADSANFVTIWSNQNK